MFLVIKFELMVEWNQTFSLNLPLRGRRKLSRQCSNKESWRRRPRVQAWKDGQKDRVKDRAKRTELRVK
jgi:hypothetical protein